MKSKTRIRIPKELYDKMLHDLSRPHEFAFERIGFLHATTLLLPGNENLVLAMDFEGVNDEHYIDDPEVGAKISGAAIRVAMQKSLDMKCGCFHVHLHSHKGKPYPSPTDKKSNPGFITSLANVAPNHVNGILILSKDGFHAEARVPKVKKVQTEVTVSVVGSPFLFQPSSIGIKAKDMFDRQSFLGQNSQHLLGNIRVGIVGYGGGGSHIGQQLAHLGVKNITIFDDDVIEMSNLNRLVGGTLSDVRRAQPKTGIAKRIITGILPSAGVTLVEKKWQQSPEELRRCDIVFGGIDSYTERDQLEAECRRFLIPLIDIGMDVHGIVDFSMTGQIIMSMPGKPCMKCYGFLTEEKLAIEAAKYGNAGGRPQVVWPNGVLASTAVGIFINLITGWAQNNEQVYLAYDGNTGKIVDHVRKRFAPEVCQHFPMEHIGEVKYSKL